MKLKIPKRYYSHLTTRVTAWKKKQMNLLVNPIFALQNQILRQEEEGIRNLKTIGNT